MASRRLYLPHTYPSTMSATMSAAITRSKRRRNSSATKSAKRRRTTKELVFHDDEGDTITFRLAGKVLSELVNGKPTLRRVTKLMIDEATGRVVDDDGDKDSFKLNEVDRLVELRALAKEAGISVDWVGKKAAVIEEPTKPATTAPIAEPIKKLSTPKKRKRRTIRKRRTARTPRKPKVWAPITFKDPNGDYVTFSLSSENFLQERVNDTVTVEKLSHLSINTATRRIEDQAGMTHGFTVQDADKLGKLRDMACHAMDLNLYWATEVPEPEAFCSIM